MTNTPNTPIEPTARQKAANTLIIAWGTALVFLPLCPVVSLIGFIGGIVLALACSPWRSSSSTAPAPIL